MKVGVPTLLRTAGFAALAVLWCFSAGTGCSPQTEEEIFSQQWTVSSRGNENDDVKFSLE